MLVVSNADRIVFPDASRTKGDVVAYYERIAPRALPHVADRPLSIKRFPKGLAAAGFFQKNVPPHYPASIERLAVPRQGGATHYPIVRAPEHLPYLANQGAIELHVPAVRASDLEHPDRVILDLDPPEGALDLVRRAALLARDALGELGLDTVPLATGSKGYHLVAAIMPTVDVEVMSVTMQKVGALLAARHPETLTTAFRIALRGERVFVDWLRNRHGATGVAAYSLRARPRASVAAPCAWDELATTAPDAFTIADVDRLVDRPDTIADLASRPADPAPFVAAVDAAFDAAGLVLERFDRFRS